MKQRSILAEAIFYAILFNIGTYLYSVMVPITTEELMSRIFFSSAGIICFAVSLSFSHVLMKKEEKKKEDNPEKVKNKDFNFKLNSQYFSGSIDYLKQKRTRGMVLFCLIIATRSFFL